MNKPVRLAKADNDVSLFNHVEEYLQRYSFPLMIISLIILGLLIVLLVFALAGVVGTEANVYYYHIGDII